MKLHRGSLALWVPMLLALVLPLHAQFHTVGCPQGTSGPQLNGFTAGTPYDSQVCLTGSFGPGTVYSILLTDHRNRPRIGDHERVGVQRPTRLLCRIG